MMSPGRRECGRGDGDGRPALRPMRRTTGAAGGPTGDRPRADLPAVRRRDAGGGPDPVDELRRRGADPGQRPRSPGRADPMSDNAEGWPIVGQIDLDRFTPEERAAWHAMFR